MATYYGYAERNAEDQIDWNAVGKSMTDTLNAEQKRRDDLKAQIDKDSFEYGQTLSNSPQGEHKGMNEYSLNYAADAQDYNLMQLRLLKSGKIKLRDYLKGRENIKQGTTQIFDMMKNYQEKYGEYAERAKTGVSGMYEGFLLGEVEGFGNLTSTMPYINPTTGKVSIGKKVPKNPNKPYDANTNPYTVKMSDNPSDFRTVQELAFALSSQVDRFDSAGAIDGIVDNFAKKFDTLKKSGSASTKIDDVRNMPNFKKSLDDMIIAEFESNPLNALSALGDFIKYGPDGELIQLTRNPAEQNDHTLLLVPNPEQPEGGIAMPDFDSESGKKLLKHMREKIAESVDAGLNRTIEYQRGYQPRAPRGGSGPTEQELSDFYQRERQKIFNTVTLPSGESKQVISRNNMFEFGAKMNVPITEEVIQGALTFDRARRELGYEGTREEWIKSGGEDKTIPTKVIKIGDVTLERYADNTEILQALESQVSTAKLKAARMKLGSLAEGGNSMKNF
jgi:hypothetical protein